MRQHLYRQHGSNICSSGGFIRGTGSGNICSGSSDFRGGSSDFRSSKRQRRCHQHLQMHLQHRKSGWQ